MFSISKLNIPSFSFLFELKIYHLSFFIIKHGAFDIADHGSIQDACHKELNKYDLARYESPSSSVVRAFDRCMGKSWVKYNNNNNNNNNNNILAGSPPHQKGALQWGSIPFRDSEFFLCPTLVSTEYSIFLIIQQGAQMRSTTFNKRVEPAEFNNVERR